MESARPSDQRGVFRDRTFLLRVPDAAARPRTRYFAGQPTRNVPPQDYADAYGQFVQKFPALTDGRGRPLSYQHFRIGLRWLEIAHSRQLIAMADAFRIAQAPGEDDARRFWVRVHNEQAHWQMPEE
jgi:hypothetical protein